MSLNVSSPTAFDDLNFLVYGESGVGKTALVATANDHPQTAPVLFVDCEGGSKTITKAPNIQNRDMDVVTVTNFDQFTEMYEFLRLHTRFINNDEEKLAEVHKEYLDVNDPTPYQTVVVDSLTEAQKYVMMGLLDVPRESINLEIDMPGIRDWGQNAEVIRQLVRNFRDLEMNVIFTALKSESKDEKTGEITCGPDLPGKLMAEIPGFLDVVGYLYTKKASDNGGVKRILMTEHRGKYLAKDRTNSLANEEGVMLDPSIPKMYDRIMNGENTHEEDED